MSRLYLSLEEMLEQSNTREGGMYKWALVSDELRFVRVIYAETHLMLVDDGETATDAGTISVADDRWRTYGLGSQKLKIGCSSGQVLAVLENAAAAASGLSQLRSFHLRTTATMQW